MNASPIYMGRMKINGWHQTGGASRTKRRCAVVRVALRVVSKGRQLRPQEKKNGLTGVVVLVLEEGIRLT